jgi:hypothetical protein
MVSGFIGNEVPRKGLRVRIPCPPLRGLPRKLHESHKYLLNRDLWLFSLGTGGIDSRIAAGALAEAIAPITDRHLSHDGTFSPEWQLLMRQSASLCVETAYRCINEGFRHPGQLETSSSNHWKEK